MAAIPFEKIYSLEDFLSYAGHQKDVRAARLNGVATNDAVSKWLNDLNTFDAAVLEYVKQKGRLGQLVPVPYSLNRGHSWANTWNELVAGETVEEWRLEQLTSGFGVHFLSSFVGSPSSESTSLELGYQALIETMKHGNFQEMPESSKDCQLSGQHYAVGMNNWTPYLFHWERSATGKRMAVPLLGNLEMPPLQTVEIEAPSGQLLIADWFRITEFTEQVKADESNKTSLNLMVGRFQETQRYAKKYGFLSVSVGNTCPKIIQRGDAILIATLDEDCGASDTDVKGSVCTDLWWATLIDKDVLCQVIATKTGSEKAQKIVADYLKNESNWASVTVPPGSLLHAYFYDDGLNSFQTESVNKKGLQTIYTVLSTVPLLWKPNMAPHKRAAPK